MRKEIRDHLDFLSEDSHRHDAIEVPCTHVVQGLEAPGTVYLNIETACQLLVNYLSVEYCYSEEKPAHFIVPKPKEKK